MTATYWAEPPELSPNARAYLTNRNDESAAVAIERECLEHYVSLGWLVKTGNYYRLPGEKHE